MSDWKYPCVQEDGSTVTLEAGKDYYWKRSEGWQWDGRERWWEFYVEIYPGMNGGGGVWIYEKSRWNGASDWQFKTPRNLTYQETCDLFRDLVANNESLSGGNPGVKSACLPADDRGFVEARSTPSTHSDSKFEMAGEPGAIQRVAGNAEGKTRDSADRRSPDGPIEHAVAGRE